MLHHLEPYDLQVAGSTPLLKLDEGKVAKPVSLNELKFYNVVMKKCPSMNEFVPSFFGQTSINSGRIEKVSRSDFGESKSDLREVFRSTSTRKEIPVSRDIKLPASMPALTDNSWSYGKLVRKMSQRKCKLVRESSISEDEDDALVYIIMEDATSKMIHPCILDLKVGTQQHSPKESFLKVQRKKEKCKSSTSCTLGLRLGGMRTYDHGAMKLRDKYYGRSLDDAGFRSAIKEFVSLNKKVIKKEIVKDIINKLCRLITVVKGTTFRFFGCSLLIAYSNLEHTVEENKTNLKVIDFANADFDSTYEDYDEGFVFGLETLKSILTNFLKQG